MSRFAVLALCVAFSWVALFLPASSAWAGEPAATPRNGDPTERLEAKIRAVLNDPTKVEVIETPLQEVVTLLKDLHGIEFQLDKAAMADGRADPEGIVTLSVNGISLKSALGLLLRPMDLNYVIRGGVLLITTKVAAEKMLELRVYNAGELVGTSANVRELAEMLRSMFKDNFTAIPFYNVLIVQTSQRGHDELSRLLDQMKDKVIIEDAVTKP